MMKLPNPFNPSLKRKEILLLRPLDFRGETLPVGTETDKGLYCKKINGVSKLFFKFGPAWTFPHMIRFLGVEGTPITAHPTIEGIKIKVSDFLKEVWPPGTYEKMPEELRNPIETDYGVICGLKATMPDENLDLGSLDVDALLRESDAAQMKDFGESTPKKNFVKDNLPILVFGFLCFIAGAFANLKKWI